MVVLFVGLRPKLILGSNNWPTNTGVTNHHGNVKDHDDDKDGDDDTDEVHDEDNNQQICTSVTSHHGKDHDEDDCDGGSKHKNNKTNRSHRPGSFPGNGNWGNFAVLKLF